MSRQYSAVKALDKETVERLTQEFTKRNTSRTGMLSYSETVGLIKESYRASEEQCTNLFRCLDVRQDGTVTFEELTLIFNRVLCAVCGHGHSCECDDVYRAFCMELHYMANLGASAVFGAEGFVTEDDVATLSSDTHTLDLIYVTRLRTLFNAVAPQSKTLTKADMAQLLWMTFLPSKEKTEKVTSFLEPSPGVGISLTSFLAGMTLLYGELPQLCHSPTLQSAPSPTEPLPLPSLHVNMGVATNFANTSLEGVPAPTIDSKDVPAMLISAQSP